MILTTFFDLVALNLGTSSSSDGVGNTLKGVLVELFLGVVFTGAFAGVGVAVAAADLLFRGDERDGSS